MDDPRISEAAVSRASSPGRALLGWIALAFVGALPGLIFPAAGFYAQLDKPSWSPPAWLFGPVWTLLYLAMGVAAWRVWRRGGWAARHRPLAWWGAQLALNAAWTPVFFGLRSLGGAMVVIVLLWVAVRLALREFFRVDGAAGWLLVPYFAWVSFALALNWVLWRMNPA